MRLIIQRVSKAKVSVVSSKKIVGEISKGLFILVGVKKGDTLQNAQNLAQKVAKIRLMADQNDKMNLSVLDTKSEILAVSQFTLFANTSDGNRPSFMDAELPDNAKPIYNHFVESLQKLGIKTEIGEFGSYMQIETILDGPVTIVLEN